MSRRSPGRLPAPVVRLALGAFRRLPLAGRRWALRLGTPNFTVGAVVVLTDPVGRVLLVRSRHHQGWALPGGLLRRGEPADAAAAREVAEELGIALTADRLVDCGAVVDAHAQQVTAVFRAEPGEPATGPAAPDRVETLEYRWFPAAGLPDPLARGTPESLRRAGLVPGG